MLQLVIVACLASNPTQCSQHMPAAASAISPQACEAWAGIEVPLVVAALRGWTVKSWRCSYPRHASRKA